MNATPEVSTNAAARVTLLIPAALRMHCDGRDQLILTASTVRAALATAGDQYASLPQHLLTRDGQLRPFVKVFVQGRDVRDLDGLNTSLADGDTVMIVPSVAGG